jgi:hypothetical protein
MGWTKVAAPGGSGANEDLVAVHGHGALTDILVIDGGSSVAGRDYVDHEIGDVAWFVRRFAATLAALLAEAPDAGSAQDEMVAAAVDATRAGYLAASAGAAVPAYAWPIAALTWVRIIHHRGEDELRLYCLGDCKTLLRMPDGSVRDLDPWTNPQEAVLQGVLAGLPPDPAARKARLLPLLRARREQQNAAAAPGVLCLRPAGPFDARRQNLRVGPGASLLCMTDGFYRLVDPYDALSPAGLIDACRARGLEAVLAELRALEARGGIGGLTVKPADDAAAVLWTAGAHDFTNDRETQWTTPDAGP